MELSKDAKVIGQLNEDQLATISKLNTEFNQLRLSLGDIELARQDILGKVKVVKDKFAENEKSLLKRYGKKAIINLKTGVVTDGD